MLVEPWNEFDEVAGAKSAVELMNKKVIPTVAAGSGRSWKGKEVGAAGDTSQRPRLHGGRADFREAEHPEELPKSVDLFFHDPFEGFRRHVPPCDAGSSGSDDHVDLGVGNPGAELPLDLIGVIRYQRAGLENMPGGGDALGQ